MWQEPTELLLIGCLTESILTLRSKSDVLTPRTNSLTFWPTVVSPKMNGTIYFVCWTSWICPCLLAATSVILYQISPWIRNPCRKEGRSRILVKVLPWRSQSQWVLYRPRQSQEIWCPERLTVRVVGVREQHSTTQKNPEKALTNVPDVNRSSWKPEHDCDTSDNVQHSQVRKQENVQSTETWKQAKVTPSDGGCRRREHSASSIDTRKAFRNLMITDSNFLDKIFRFLQKKLGGQESNPFWKELQEESGDQEDHEYWTDWESRLCCSKFGRSLCWTRSTLAHDQVKSWTKAILRVYSDYVLRLGRASSGEEVIARWSNQVREFQVHYPVEEFLDIDGEAIEFERHIFPGFTTLQILRQSHNDLQSENKSPEQFLHRIISMSMFNEIEWTKKNSEEISTSNSWNSTHNDFKQVIGLSSVLEMNGNGMKQEITDQKEDGKLQQQRWYGSSRRPIIPSSQVSVL